jgi:hypothetical protein
MKTVILVGKLGIRIVNKRAWLFTFQRKKMAFAINL